MRRGSKLNRLFDRWLGIPALNLLAAFRRRRDPPVQLPRRVGVMCSPALGDTLLFSSALQDLRAALPDTEIVHFCMRENHHAAEIIPGADRRIIIPLTRPGEALAQFRREPLDVLLDFTSWQRLTAFYSCFSGARYTVGFATPGQRRARAYDRAVPHRDDRHETANFRALLEESGLPLQLAPPHLPAIEVGRPQHIPFAGEPDLVALHLWASGQRSHLREWPEARWIELAGLLARPETLFIVTGAPSDRPRSEAFVDRLLRLGLRAECFTSPDGFLTLTDVLRRARVLVTVNTGVMHLAAIAGARTVAINGPNRNGRWGPVGPRALGVESPGEGCGFLHLGFNFDGNPEDCMDRIGAETVAAAANALVRATPGAAPDAAAVGPVPREVR